MTPEELGVALAARKYSPLELLQLEVHIQNSSAADKPGLLELVRGKRGELDQKPARGRAAMQDWTSFPNFLTEALWKMLDEASDIEAIAAVCEHLGRMGLRHPSEPTSVVLVACLLRAKPVFEMPNQHNYLCTCKSHMLMHLQKLAPAIPYIVRLPVGPGQATADLMARAGAEHVVAPRMPMLELLRRADMIPLRGSNKLVKQAVAPQQGGLEQLLRGLLNYADSQSSQGSCSSSTLELPRPMKPKQASLQALLDQVQQPVEPAPLLALANRPWAEERLSKAAAAVAPQQPALPTPNSEATAVAPYRLAVPTPNAETAVAPQQLALPMEKLAEGAAAAPAANEFMAAHAAPAEAKTPGNAALVPFVSETATGLQDSLERLRHGAGAGRVRGRGRGRGQQRGRGAAAFLRRPAAAPEARMRPAANGPAAMKRPAAVEPQATPALKRPAAAVEPKRPAAVEPVSKPPAGVVPRTHAARLAARPWGCSKCRWHPGCCPSCYK